MLRYRVIWWSGDGQHDYSTLTEAIDALRYFPHKQASLQTLLFGFAVRTRKIFLFR
jgi:hypothetical protein